MVEWYFIVIAFGLGLLVRIRLFRKPDYNQLKSTDVTLLRKLRDTGDDQDLRRLAEFRLEQVKKMIGNDPSTIKPTPCL